MNKPENSFQIIWFFFKKHRLRVIFLVGLSLLVGGLEAATVAAVYPILNAAFEQGAAAGNIILSLFQRTAALLPVDNKLIALSSLFMIIALLALVAKYVSINKRVRFGINLVEEGQNSIFSRYIRADYQFFMNHRQGELLYNVATSPQRLSTLVNAISELVSGDAVGISARSLVHAFLAGNHRCDSGRSPLPGDQQVYRPESFIPFRQRRDGGRQREQHHTQ